ncbi:hypothetical protein EDD90_3285 [Streptomyces sp. Ag109_O5-1]|uniref:hypothetical protein n=1 Tax=Streptomyces sp. Ag109_O5-1 TaxID=1938851 RepID=UPI000F4D48F7|nr:hypothetical protein [Streptomyces sp. Ag109_O5-1]RPE40249.1 hypothetical protein EDD90_3285 [Streptomyces sp. Ag109_O5-1]
MPYTVINLGGVAVGVGIILMFLIRWWFREKRQWAALVPFVLAHLYGLLAALATFTAWSLLGIVTWAAIWAANAAGYAGLVWGVGGNSPMVTRGHPIVLTNGGFVVVFLFTLVFFALWKWAPRISNGKLSAGAFSGVCLALSGSVAGIAAVPLGSGANMLGALFTGTFA